MRPCRGASASFSACSPPSRMLCRTGALCPLRRWALTVEGCRAKVAGCLGQSGPARCAVGAVARLSFWDCAFAYWQAQASPSFHYICRTCTAARRGGAAVQPDCIKSCGQLTGHRRGAAAATAAATTTEAATAAAAATADAAAAGASQPDAHTTTAAAAATRSGSCGRPVREVARQR